MPTLLVVDDEAAIQHAFQKAFGADLTLLQARSAGEAFDLLAARPVDAVVLDIQLPDSSGLETFARIREHDARIPVILITGHGTTDLAIEAMKVGAFEYLLKPLELTELRVLVDRALRSSRLMRVPAAIAEQEPASESADLLVGRCAPMQAVYKSIGRVARQDVTVLIRGESGTGKELVARAIYQHSHRASRPFLAINCAAIPEQLLESELFGHEKGAFTGADRKRIGKFEQASGGTIFLDEVGEMAPLTQAKVLRLIQEQRFERVGGDETIQGDVRLIAATNAELERLVDAGKFRRDLYFRLNVFAVDLPPLRERGSDLPLLIDHFVRRFGRELGRPVSDVAPETRAALEAYGWPGNVRELQSVLKQALLQMRGSVLLPEDLPAAVRGGSAPDAIAPAPGDAASAFDWDAYVSGRVAAGSESLYAEALEVMEREVLVRVLRHTGGNQLQAARILGITRGSVRTKIRALGISIGRNVWSDDDRGDP
jgi:two-component system nitrogen regulation response regulator GlnG